MPSPRHDEINNLFSKDPKFIPEVMRECLGVDLPANLPVWEGKNELNDRISTDFHPDGVYYVGHRQSPDHGLIVEIQQTGDREKCRLLPRYAAMLWIAWQCPVTVMVVCPSNAAAVPFRDRITTELPGYTFQAEVLSPREIPLLTDPKEIATNPKMAALKMMAHGNLTEVREIFVKGLESLPHDYAMKYYDHVQRMTADRAGRKLEELVKKTTVYSDFVREHEAIGEARGEAKGRTEEAANALLMVLSARNLDVSEDVRARITTCGDLDQLEAWVRRAVAIGAVDELFR